VALQLFRSYSRHLADAVVRYEVYGRQQRQYDGSKVYGQQQNAVESGLVLSRKQPFVSEIACEQKNARGEAVSGYITHGYLFSRF
jgi:hypothetical protein